MVDKRKVWVNGEPLATFAESSNGFGIGFANAQKMTEVLIIAELDFHLLEHFDQTFPGETRSNR